MDQTWLWVALAVVAVALLAVVTPIVRARGAAGGPAPAPDTAGRTTEPAAGAVAAGASAGVAGAVAVATVEDGPHPGSLLPAADGSSPSPTHGIKANTGAKRYYTPDSPYFRRTRADMWFSSAADAQEAGFRG